MYGPSLMSKLVDHAIATKLAIEAALFDGKIDHPEAIRITTMLSTIPTMADDAATARQAADELARTGVVPRDFVREYRRREGRRTKPGKEAA